MQSHGDQVHMEVRSSRLAGLRLRHRDRKSSMYEPSSTSLNFIFRPVGQSQSTRPGPKGYQELKKGSARLLRGSWDPVTRIISKVTILITT